MPRHREAWWKESAELLRSDYERKGDHPDTYCADCRSDKHPLVLINGGALCDDCYNHRRSEEEFISGVWYR